MLTKMKIILNVIVICLIICIFDFSIFYIRCFKYSELNSTGKLNFSCNFFEQFGFRPYRTKMTSFQQRYNSLTFHDFKSEHNKKNAILLFGCSFGYGFELELKDTLASLLQNYSNRNVYNRAVCGGGLKDFLFQSQLFYILKNYENIKLINPDIKIDEFIENLGFDKMTTDSFKRIFQDTKSSIAIRNNYELLLKEQAFDYILYVFIQDQPRRMHLDLLDPTENVYWSNYSYDGSCFSLHNTFFEKFRILALPDFFKEQMVFYSLRQKPKKNLDLIVKYLSDSKEYIQNSFSKENSDKLKLIVVNYRTDDDYYLSNLKNNIKDTDIVVIDINDYLNDRLPQEKYVIRKPSSK